MTQKERDGKGKKEDKENKIYLSIDFIHALVVILTCGSGLKIFSKLKTQNFISSLNSCL